MSYKVKTQDVDGSGSRKFKTLDAAVKRFLEMAGGTIDGWIAEQFYAVIGAGNPAPKIEDIACLRAVSAFGTVVTLYKVES